MSKIHRIKHTNPYVMLDKTALNDVRLSWQAKGLHAYLMSLPDDWQVYVTDLAKRGKNGRDSVLGILKELETSHYLERTQGRDERGVFVKKDFTVYEIPKDVECEQSLANKEFEPWPGNPLTDNPLTDNPLTENPQLLNNDLTNKTEKEIDITAKQDTSIYQGVIAADQKKSVEAVVVNFQQVEKTVAVNQQLNDGKPGDTGKDIEQCHVADRQVIADELTDQQLAMISGAVENVMKEGVVISAPEQTKAEIAFKVIQKVDKAGGNNLQHQINSAMKLIKTGRWTTPFGFHEYAKLSREAAARNAETGKTATPQKPSKVAPVCNAAISAQHYRDSKQGKIDSIKKSIVSIQATFTDRMAQFRDASFFTAQRKQLARYEQQLRELGVVTADSIDLPVESISVSQQNLMAGGVK